MAYIFDVCSGKLVVLDIELVVASVPAVRQAIEAAVGVPADKQVLIVSGGDVLHEDERIADRGCGTEENPVFLFALSALESPECYLLSEAEIHPVEKIKSEQFVHVQEASPSLECLENCYYFAERLQEDIREISKLASRCLYEQRMLFQGWLAVVANLDDFCSCCKNVLGKLEAVVEEYKKSEAPLISCLAGCHEWLDQLRELKIPSDESNDWSIGGHETTLLDWLETHVATTLKCDVNSMIKSTHDSLARISMVDTEKFLSTAYQQLEFVSTSENRNVKGIEDRFRELQSITEELNDLAYNATSYAMVIASSLSKFKSDNKLRKDNHLLSEVCRMHQPGFTTVVSMHESALNFWKTACASKQDLLRNIHARLRWTIKVENDINKLDGKARFMLEFLTRTRNRLLLIEQMRQAPTIFPRIVEELRRRRQFNSAFSKVKGRVFPVLNAWISRETSLRRCFMQEFGHHFLADMTQDSSDLSHGEPDHDNIEDKDLDSNTIPGFLETEVNQSLQGFHISVADRATATEELDTLEKLVRAVCSRVESSIENSTTTKEELPKCTSIRVGDLVVISLTRPPSSRQFEIVAASHWKYFIHKNSYDDLNLLGENKANFVFGRVTKIQHCMIKKEPNSFGLPIGCRFFIVKCRKYVEDESVGTSPCSQQSET